MAKTASERMSGRYGDKDTPKPKEVENHPAEPRPEKGEESGSGEMELRAKAMSDMHDRHRAERRDMHGSHRGDHDKMHERHMKEMSAMMDSHPGTGKDVGSEA